ncbi:hypothetical protein [Flectobacillus major]|uniref:hypothetical protein n=1 Tax=Flectobacillus major TaxID=103 RepID=UPI00047CEFB2|nr:hypothetical protein [Flectobacillus major]
MAKKDFMNIMKEKTHDLRPSLLSSEELIKSQIVILDELRDLIPPLTAEESTQLEQNIVKHGVKDPLSIWETDSTAAGLDQAKTPIYILIDGHNRFSICKKNHLDYRINIMRFASLDEVKEYMIDFQLGRRNLTPEQISYYRGLKYLQQKNTRGGNQKNGDLLDASVALSQEYGVSGRTIKRDGDFAMGLDKLETGLKQDILVGKTKVAKSTITALGKTLVSKPITNIEELESVVQENLPPVTETLPVNSLQAEIRDLVNKKLDKNACQELITKAQELLLLL